jgi:DNA-binding NtrC family response regulator
MSAQLHSAGRPRVLFIDDEPRVLNSMRIMFRRQYDTFFADNGPAALSILRAHDIDVIVCDHRMPGMTGVEVLTQARAISPRSVRILLTGYADLNAVEGSINEGEVFRFLTKPCAPDELKRTIELATNLALEPEIADSDVAVPSLEATIEEDLSDVARRAAAEYARNDDRSGDVPDTTQDMRASAGSRLHAGLSVLVFSNDELTYQIAKEATRGRVPIHRASNIVQVVKLLDEKRPGVLLTDISEDRATIQTMTAKLKEHLPQLVTIAVSEHRDVLDMVWLINHGQIFRFLRKPLSAGRCAVSLKAALEHHRKLLSNPGLVKRHTVETTAESVEERGLLSRLTFLRKIWSMR